LDTASDTTLGTTVGTTIGTRIGTRTDRNTHFDIPLADLCHCFGRLESKIQALTNR